MAERICPMMTGPDKLVRCHDGCPDQSHYTFPAGLKCQLWENGDCGLKVPRGDRWKEMWEKLRALLDGADLAGRNTFILREMDKIEAEMGKG